jgi:hypothetical protein
VSTWRSSAGAHRIGIGVPGPRVSNVARVRLLAEAPGLEHLLGPLATTLPLVVIAAENGGYYPTTWNWAALVVASAAAAVLVAREAVKLSRLEVVTISALFALAASVALSAPWTDSLPSTVLEVERDVLYAVAVLAAADALGVAVAHRELRRRGCGSARGGSRRHCSPAVKNATDGAAARAGFVCEQSPERLACKLLRLLFDKDERSATGARAREFARRYDWSMVGRELATMYSQFAAEGRRAGAHSPPARAEAVDG